MVIGYLDCDTLRDFSSSTSDHVFFRMVVPRALAVLNGGNALATVVTAPLGSYLGSIIGWRGAFFCVVPIAAIALVWKLVALPSMIVQPQTRSQSALQLIKKPPIAWGMAAVGMFFMGQFALFTYLRPFLETVTHVSVSALSTLLLILGASGFIGTTLIGRFLKHSLHRLLIVVPVLMAIIAVALILLGGSFVETAILLGLWGLIATSAPVAWWTWLAMTLPQDAEGGGGLMVAVVQLAISCGAVAGGMLYDRSGYQATFIASAALLILAAALAACVAFSAARRSGTAQ